MMDILASLQLLAPRSAFRQAALKQLTAAAQANQSTHIWQRTVTLQAELRQQRPQHSFGLNQLLRFMEWHAALYRALLEHGLTQQEASRLIEGINWEMFGAATANTFMLSRLRSAKRLTRVQWVLDLMFATLFTKPFRKQEVSVPEGIGFDVTVCPLADYFKQQGLPELTRFAACDLDYRMAETWGVSLQRTQTIAAGDARCDFRFRISPTETTREDKR